MDRRNRVEELFHQALALEPIARSQFLAAACETDPEVHAEVTQLISAFEQRGSFIDTPAYHGIEVDDDLSDSLIGTQIAHYKVIRLIKKSGMGEVYLARDRHLPRDVALKLLPLAFTGDESRLRRFILEAEAASSLNHPNILTIHEIGHIHDVHYIATEFVDGETLRERLSAGPLALTEVLEIAIGVANALVASHAAGIVHRDIKPENIMIRCDGYVKVLDFGLAKLTQGPDIRIAPEHRGISRMDTEPGTFMGTVGYLSPEQAQTLAVDTRSDVFSLGVVIYEMITGQNPFNRGSLRDVIDAIVRLEPTPVSQFAPGTPVLMQSVLTKALCKDQLGRYQHTTDMLTDLKVVRSELQQHAIPSAFSLRNRRLRWTAAGLALITMVVFATLLLRALNGSRDSVSDSSAQLTFRTIQNWKQERGEGGVEARFSHDGKLIAFTMLKNQLSGIWVKPVVSGAEALQLVADESENNWPIWSPDDKHVAFFSYRGDTVGIWVSPVTGGEPRFLGPIEGRSVRLVCWSKDGRTIYYVSANNLFSFDVANAAVVQLTKFQNQSVARSISLSPNEDRIAYVGVEDQQSDIWISWLNGESAFRITNDSESERAPLWHPDGKRIVYTSNRGGAFQVFVAYLDGSKPTQVTVAAEDHVISDISRDGRKLLRVNSVESAEIFAVDAVSGQETEITSGSGLTLWPEVSPDGRLVVFQATNTQGNIASNSNIMVKRSTGEGATTSVAESGFAPTWSPDGSRIFFLRFTGGLPDLFSVSPVGTDERRVTTGGIGMNGLYLLPATKYGRNFCWSKAGTQIVYAGRSDVSSDLLSIGAEGSSEPMSVNTDPAKTVYEPMCGPTGEIAYAIENRQASPSTWSLWIRANDTSKLVLKGNAVLRPIGWLEQGELLVAQAEEEGSIIQGYPVPVRLIRVSGDGQKHTVCSLSSTYFWNIQLAPDRRSIAFVSDQDKSDNIWITDINAAPARKLTSNKEPKMFFGNINWAKDNKTIYFGKQSSAGLITIFDNFN